MGNSIYKSIYDDLKKEREVLISGVTIGIVTELGEEENFGKVKVQILNIAKEDFITDFIRVMTPISGKNTGVFYLPQVGDEVVLSFCDGDITKPYILGCLWNEKSPKPTEVTKDTKDFIMIKSRSGHKITIGDKDGEEIINITSKNGLMIDIKDKEKTITLQDKDGKNSIILDSNKGEVTIKGDKKISLASGGAKLILDGGSNNVKIEASSGVSLKGTQSTKIEGQQVAISGTTGLDIKSSAQANIEGSAMLNLKGGMVKIN